MFGEAILSDCKLYCEHEFCTKIRIYRGWCTLSLKYSNISRKICKSDKQTSAQHEFVYKIRISRGKQFLYFKLSVF